MLVSVCCYVLQACDTTKSHSVDTSRQAACLSDIRDVADLLKSISPVSDAATTAYGRALDAACDKLSALIPIPMDSHDGVDWTTGHRYNTEMAGRVNHPVEPVHVEAQGTAVHQGQGLSLAFSSQQGQEAEPSIENPARLFADDCLPWFGAMSDIPGGDLLDTLCMPWQQ